MRKTVILLLLLVIHFAGKGQDYYILKKNDQNKERYENLKKAAAEFKIKSKNDYSLVKPDSLKQLNRFMFNDTNRAQAVQLAFGRGDINGQLYANLINDVFISKSNKYLGEISLGSVISNTSSSDSLENQKASNINNFFNGGGNVFLKYVYLLPFGFKDGDDNFTFLYAPSIRVASNLPKLSQSERLESWNIEVANELTISLNGHNNKLGIFFKPKVAFVNGSKKFAEAFLDDSKSFVYLQFQGAVKVSDSFLINLAFKPIISGNRSEYFKEKQFSTIGIQALID